MRLALVLVIGSMGCGDEAASRPAKLGYILPAILEPSCATAGCHSALAQTAGLVLEGEPVLVRETLIRKGYIYPYQPAGSPLLNFLTGDYGVRRMPPDAPLAADDVAFIERWIAAGAPP